jgi:hypothetical protein
MNLHYINTISWHDAFKLWSEGEAHLPHWIRHYTERGFDSWEKRRKNSVKDLHPDELTWKLYKIQDKKIVLDFYGGPFRAWIKKYYGTNTILPFKELAQKAELQQNPAIQEIMTHFPQKSVLVGLQKGDQIIIIDGMHRCSALAVAQFLGKPVDASLDIVLAEFDGELPLLGQVNSPA